MKSIFLGALLATCVAFSSGCTADRAISIPVPDGFAASSAEFPKFAESLTAIAGSTTQKPTTVREAMLPIAVLKALKSGAAIYTERFMLDIRDNQDLYYPESYFDGYVNHVRGSGRRVFTDEELAAQFRNIPNLTVAQQKAIDSFRITGMREIGLAVDQQDAIGTAYLMTLSDGEQTAPFVMVSSVVWINGHLIYLKVFSKVEGQADVKWAVDSAKSWASQYVTANR